MVYKWIIKKADAKSIVARLRQEAYEYFNENGKFCVFVGFLYKMWIIKDIQ